MQPANLNQQTPTTHIDPLLMKKGLTYGKAVTNLTEQVKDNKERNLVIIGTVATIVGVAVAIATFIGGIFIILSEKREDDGTGRMKLLPGEDWKFPVGLVMCEFGFLLPAFIAGGIVWLIGMGISELTLIYARKTHEKFTETFENTAFIENDDLADSLTKCNEARQRSMIDEMNFTQLTIARYTLGRKTFGQLIESVEKEPHKLWKNILELSSEDKSDKDILKKLQSPAIQRLKNTGPLFAAELRKHLNYRNNPKIESFLNPSPFPKQLNVAFKCEGKQTIYLDQKHLIEHNQEFKDSLGNISFKQDGLEFIIPAENYEKFAALAFVTLKCEEKMPILANRLLLENRCEYFKRVFENKTETKILPEEYDEYLLYIDALTNDNFEWNLENTVQLLPLAEKFQNTTLLNFIENTIIINRTGLDEESMSEILLNYSIALPTLKTIEDNNQCKILISDDNLDELVEKGKKFNFTNLLNKCKSYAFEKVKNGILNDVNKFDRVWLEKCLELEDSCHDKNSALKTYLSANINTKNFHIIYKFAHKKRKDEALKKGDVELQEACLKFIKTNADSFIEAAFKSKWYKSIILSLKDVDYKEFSEKLQSQIKKKTLPNIYEFAEEKKDQDLLNECLVYVKNHQEDIKNEVIWEYESMPKEVVEILYPTPKITNSWQRF